jgi:hypothetical protein
MKLTGGGVLALVLAVIILYYFLRSRLAPPEPSGGGFGGLPILPMSPLGRYGQYTGVYLQSSRAYPPRLAPRYWQPRYLVPPLRSLVS